MYLYILHVIFILLRKTFLLPVLVVMTSFWYCNNARCYDFCMKFLLECKMKEIVISWPHLCRSPPGRWNFSCFIQLYACITVLQGGRIPQFMQKPSDVLLQMIIRMLLLFSHFLTSFIVAWHLQNSMVDLYLGHPCYFASNLVLFCKILADLFYICCCLLKTKFQKK